MSHSRSPIPSYHSPWTITSSTSDNPWYRSVRRSSNAGMQQSPPSPTRCEESQTPILPPIVKTPCPPPTTNKPKHTRSSSDPVSSSNSSFFQRTFMKWLRPTPPPIQTSAEALAIDQRKDGWTVKECKSASSPISPSTSSSNSSRSRRPDTPYKPTISEDKSPGPVSRLQRRRLFLLQSPPQQNQHLQVPIVADEAYNSSPSSTLSPSLSMNPISEEENDEEKPVWARGDDDHHQEEDDENVKCKEKNISQGCYGKSRVSHQQLSPMRLHSHRHSVIDIPNNLSPIPIHRSASC